MTRGIAITAAMLALTACSGSAIRTATTQSTAALTPTSPAPSAPSASATASSAGEPRTLDAAAASAQENADRFSSGDYAGSWELLAPSFQKLISHDDYVEVAIACSGGADGSGMPIKVVGVRMSGEDKAIVRLELLGVKESRTMLYIDGRWLQDVSPGFKSGMTADERIAARKADGSCSG